MIVVRMTYRGGGGGGSETDFSYTVWVVDVDGEKDVVVRSRKFFAKRQAKKIARRMGRDRIVVENTFTNKRNVVWVR